MLSMTLTIIPTVLFTLFTITMVHAGQLAVPHTFTAGTPAVAAEVNKNFNAVQTAVNDNNARITALEDMVAALQRRLVALESSQVMALAPYLTVDETSDLRGPRVELSGVNVQIVNGLSTTDSKNGLGNLIIGYDEINAYAHHQRCSDGTYADQTDCENAGEVWSNSHKSGSHYLVLGAQNSYSQYGGLVAGYRNFATNAMSTVNGGIYNTASGVWSWVGGGTLNTASGEASSVSAGSSNTAEGESSSIGGGVMNTASGENSSVCGGAINTAEGESSSISGGYENLASNYSSSVNGGANNTASGYHSSVSGGYGNEATNSCASVSGGSNNFASGLQSTVNGGRANTANGVYSSVGGGLRRSVNNSDDWRAGALFQDQ